jgi:hypothetical protein
MLWFIIFVLLVISVAEGYLLLRAGRRLLEFDELMEVIFDPMQEYQAELEKITSAEGLLTDHPEVVAFHRANVIMLARINSAITSIGETRPQKKQEVKGLPPQVE